MKIETAHEHFGESCEKCRREGVAVTVPRDDLLAVLAAVPGWVPEGAAGDDLWTHESLKAKERLLALLGDEIRADR